jgi:hypothetical protein
MGPKIDRPCASSISMRTRSPNDRNGVLGAPNQIVSTECSSAMQE